ncbi:MAG: PD-(D/E)XK nuclease family protein [Gammaproteobacteria bacterium]|nr:PD-(D/E)XK nuclease family protein [Gammaproteobacteria bacterium]MDE0260444.1 PD-(D/E)XK nuclease family protein [Gammaproteobacteria bacterium]
MDRKATAAGMTRVEEVDRLVGDSGFLRYHAEYVKRREFNAFDVLRYAEYEIRHSNVMAWLLDPNETHGIGRAFLEWFLGQAKLPGRLPRKIVRGEGGQTVRVERELYYVDVVIFLESDHARHIVAIENKPAWASPEHYEQVRAHLERLRPEYSGHDIHCVLLSTSREGIDGEDEIAHVSWRDVGAQIKTMHDADAFWQEEVAAFIRQYLVAVGHLIGPEESDADYLRKLLDDHHSLLKYMLGVLGDEGGEQEIRAMVPKRHADTVVRLVKDFGQEPERLRSEVRDLLASRGIETTITASKGKAVLWLSWDLQEAQGLGLGGTGGRIYWFFEFTLRSVVVVLESSPGRRDAVDRIAACMRKIPVDRCRRGRYPMKAGAFNHFHFYRHELVGDETLSGTSTAAVTVAVRQAVDEFLDAEDSDYTRINDYFRCLAFQPAPVAEETK